LLILTGLAALYLLGGLAASLILGFVLKKPMGRRIRPNYDQMRALCKDYDYSAYDQMEKEAFVLRHNGADLQCVFIPAPNGAKQAKCVISAHGFGLNLMFSARYVPMFHALVMQLSFTMHGDWAEARGLPAWDFLKSMT